VCVHACVQGRWVRACARVSLCVSVCCMFACDCVCMLN